MELEAVGGGEVPPELVLLPHDERELAAEGVVPLPGGEPEHLGRAGGRVDQAREHLERGRLPRPVRPEEGDHLARLDRERDVVDGLDFLVVPLVEPPEGAEEAVLLLEDAVGLRQADPPR